MSAAGPFDTFLYKGHYHLYHGLDINQQGTFFGLICLHLMLQGNTVKYLTPDSVINYIQQHELYR